MSHAKRRPGGEKRTTRRKGPHHVIVARGDKVRSFAVRPASVLGGIALSILLVSGALTAGAYVFLKDDLTITSVAAQDEIRQDYELQIADLNRQMESLVSRQLVEREVLNNEVAALLERQGDLIQRQQLLTGLATDALAVGIDVLPMLAPLPIANPLREGPATTGVGGPIDPMTTGGTDPDRDASVGHADTLAAIEFAAEWLEESQRDALETLAEAVSERTDQLAGALQTLGHADDAGGIGGPLIPFEGDLVDSIELELAAFANLQEFARTLPLAQPLTSVDVTSSFGRRVDPFLGQTAMHSGVDLRAAAGTTVMATGPGTVIRASTNGGYGKMVEIDHGNGVTTIYAHLSSIAVRLGQHVTTGVTVGRAGSTGRSTGPHLHYEINRNDRAIDPMPYLRTGAEIAGLL